MRARKRFNNQKTNPKNRSSCKTKKKKFVKKKSTRISSYRGYYKGIRCDSRWELAFLIYCLDKRRKISRCSNYFVYTFKGKEHKYFPDFAVNNVIVEIKGKWKKNLNLKLASVVKAGFKVKLIDSKNIQPYLKYCYKKYETEQLEKLYDKRLN